MKLKNLKKFFFILTILVILYLIVAIVPALTYRKLENGNPLPGYYKKGVYHLHSHYSDGSGSISEIAEAGKRAGVDFIILTDHGRPNRKCVAATSLQNGVLIIGGSELSLYCGHLSCLGFAAPEYIFPPEPQSAIDEMSSQGAVSFIAHPLDDKIPWTDWSVHGYTGMEIVSCYASARKASLLRLLLFPLQYMFDSDYALTRTLYYPQAELEKWYVSNRNGRYYGIYALDAHANLPVTDNWSIKLPSYESMFKVLMIYVRMDGGTGDSATVKHIKLTDSLRRGDFFNVVESIAPANGFEAWYSDGQNHRTEMGGYSKTAEGKLVLMLPFTFSTRILVKKNGHFFCSADSGGRKQVEIPAEGKGVYYLEIHAVESRFPKLPWILTNPFYLGVERNEIPMKISPEDNDAQTTAGGGFGVPGEMFKVEKNDGSTGELYRIDPPAGWPVTGLRFKLGHDQRAGENFWSVLAVRRDFDLSPFKGIAFIARADRKRRFWVELRTGLERLENWYQRSFQADEKPREHRIPFHQLYFTFTAAPKEAATLLNKVQTNMNRKNVKALFFSINNAIAEAGASGFLEIQNVRFY